MSFLGKVFGGSAAEPIKALGEVADELFTSDDERLDKQALLAKIASTPHLAQAKISLVEAKSRNWFQAGWRPAIGWVCAWNLLYITFLRDVVVWVVALAWPEAAPLPPPIGIDIIFELIMALLGLGGLRTVEKIKGAAK